MLGPEEWPSRQQWRTKFGLQVRLLQLKHLRLVDWQVCRFCATLQPFSVLHDPTHALSQCWYERSVMLLDGLHGVPEHLRNVVDPGTGAEQINREGVAEAMRMRVRHTSASAHR